MSVLSDAEKKTLMRNEQWARMWAEYTAAGWRTIQLWPEGAPGFNVEYEQEQPRILLAPTKSGRPRGIVLVSAGGGFNYKTYIEATAMAECYLKAGMNVAILDYRCRPYTKADALCDAKRAVRLLRVNAAEYNIDPEHIAVCGFSAGGIVSNMAASLYDAGDAQSQDPVERVSSRPDAAVICYGAMSIAPGRGGLGYDRAAQNEAARLSPELNLPFDAPPYFIFQTANDDPRHALNLAAALTDKGIPLEVHIFKDGRHGQALYDGQNGTDSVPHTAHWAELACEWLAEYGF